MNRLSIIICTYNRPDLLQECLNSLLDALDASDIEVNVINNNPHAAFNDEILSTKNVNFFFETEEGLSNARNKGLKVSNGDWLFYLDDDAKLDRNAINEIIKTINRYDFSMFTGIWKAWYKIEPPKWLPYSTGNYILKGKSGIREIGQDYVSGGVMIIKKSVLEEVGGFPTNLGMKGNKVAYGEESFVENRVKELGYKVGINPNIVIDHLVGEHKYKLSWHLKAARAKGEADSFINGKESLLVRVSKCTVNTAKSIVGGFLKVITKKDYYIQNLYIDSLSHIQYFRGTLKK